MHIKFLKIFLTNLTMSLYYTVIINTIFAKKMLINFAYMR